MKRNFKNKCKDEETSVSFSKRFAERIYSRSKILRNKRGLSTLFIAVFVAMLAFLLISVLFFGLTMSNIGLSQYIRTDVTRMQEQIQLDNITADANDNYILFLQVTNTGSISVRLKALYINERLICDPSSSSILGDKSYIGSQGNVSIPLSSFNLKLATNLNVNWTVTTERGTRSSELGINLWQSGSQSDYVPGRFFYGPLALYFDNFTWTSGNGPLTPGWSIPKGTSSVSWQIHVMDVDTRKITLNTQSSFSLVGNDNIPNSMLTWYIDPQHSNMTLIPGTDSTITYTWDKPSDQNGAKQIGITKFQSSESVKNFLLFSGYFTEINGTKTPFGQSIPFESVLIT